MVLVTFAPPIPFPVSSPLFSLAGSCLYTVGGIRTRNPVREVASKATAFTVFATTAAPRQCLGAFLALGRGSLLQASCNGRHLRWLG